MDVRRAESPHQHLMAGPAALDPRRAEAANKHVKALNSQFASWVQLQLQNNPSELWEDGMKDYLSHASEIMEKFKDVVDWLRQNKAGVTAVSSPSPANDEKTASPATVNSKFLVQPGSDNGQKSPTTGASSLAFQNSNPPSLFSFSSQKKTAASGGLFDNKDTPGNSSKSPFQFGGNNGFSTPTTPSIFSPPGSQSFSMPTPTLFSVNPQPILTGNKNAAEASGDADEGESSDFLSYGGSPICWHTPIMAIQFTPSAIEQSKEELHLSKLVQPSMAHSRSFAGSRHDLTLSQWQKAFPTSTNCCTSLDHPITPPPDSQRMLKISVQDAVCHASG